LTIPNFPWNGGNNDIVKVCMNNSNCCESKEFDVPDCLIQGGPCSISNLSVEVGTCTSDSTYKVVVNFSVSNPPSNVFSLWANGVLLGTYEISQLPLVISNFPWDGGTKDFVKVCFGNGGISTCCAIKEFNVPDCLNPTGPCTITNLIVETGACTGNATYKVVVNFNVSNPASNQFELYANGVLFGTYNLSQLPLAIDNFPWGGGANDQIKVCIVPNAPNVALCCAFKSFQTPSCLNDDCKIYDLVVLKSPCLCGQFFALLQFKYTNPGQSFDVVLNGNVEATYPYNFPQPIIVGPLNGDNTTEYKFLIKDHNVAGCADDFNLGKVDCPQSPTFSPTDGGSVILAPNPASDWLNVLVQLRSAGKPGQSSVDVYHADGRLMMSRIVPDASNFQLDISNLPAGMYRMVLQTEVGRLDGTFAKQ
ncbi:MAG: T9SS type A sorting domain-containing protein, partial [Bacteroidetes bacterium]|nr:T9SS type A sorting domain-containing protein [Bacteroidota bacterium]